MTKDLRLPRIFLSVCSFFTLRVKKEQTENVKYHITKVMYVCTYKHLLFGWTA